METVPIMKKARFRAASFVAVYFLFCAVELFASISQCGAPRKSGVRYEGAIHNSSYRFSAVIPPPFTGWGADPGAPFHGFIIYLTNDGQSCIDFSIGIRVSLPEDEKPKRRSFKPGARTRMEKPIHGNGWKGIETIASGLDHGTSIDNIVVTFSIPRSIPVEGGPPVSDVVEVGATLMTPTQDRHKTELAFRQFLSQLAFW